MTIFADRPIRQDWFRVDVLHPGVPLEGNFNLPVRTILKSRWDRHDFVFLGTERVAGYDRVLAYFFLCEPYDLMRGPLYVMCTLHDALTTFERDSFSIEPAEPGRTGPTDPPMIDDYGVLVDLPKSVVISFPSRDVTNYRPVDHEASRRERMAKRMRFDGEPLPPLTGREARS